MLEAMASLYGVASAKYASIVIETARNLSDWGMSSYAEH